jgi:hypothetical protein
MKYFLIFLTLYVGFMALIGTMAHKEAKEVVKHYYVKKIREGYTAKRIINGADEQKCYMGSEPVSCLFYDDIEVKEVKRE